MLSALPGANVNEDDDEEASAVDSRKEASRIAGAATGAANHGERTAMGVAGILCCNSLALSGFAALVLPAGLCAAFSPGPGTVAGAATVGSCAGAVASGPNSAAKLPEVREPELTWPDKPADEAGVALVGFAGSRALVTIKVRAESPSGWKGSFAMDASRAPTWRRAQKRHRKREKAVESRESQSGRWNRAKGQECHSWASAAQTRQNLTTPR